MVLKARKKTNSSSPLQLLHCALLQCTPAQSQSLALKSRSRFADMKLWWDQGGICHMGIPMTLTSSLNCKSTHVTIWLLLLLHTLTSFPCIALTDSVLWRKHIYPTLLCNSSSAPQPCWTEELQQRRWLNWRVVAATMIRGQRPSTMKCPPTGQIGTATPWCSTSSICRSSFQLICTFSKVLPWFSLKYKYEFTRSLGGTPVPNF